MARGAVVGHQPVAAGSVVGFLGPVLEDGGVVVDATLGRGGHAAALLEASPRATLVGIDRDPEAIQKSGARLAPYADRIRLVRDDFKNLAAVLERLGHATVRGVLFDFGVSSPQLDTAARGFSFRVDGPLDMRMDPDQKLTAHHVVNDYPQKELARVIARYGEERFATRIARRIVDARPIQGTVALAEVVKEAIPAATRRTGGHPARRTFQALRIEVNSELRAIERAIPDAIDRLETGGRVVAISYHSLEDRLVKRAFVDASKGCTCPPEIAICVCGASAKIRILTRRPSRPPAEEIAENPRAEAAKLRAAEKLGAAP
jgi:16S rRNA (cytosine1402-N4)-methyltransferase